MTQPKSGWVDFLKCWPAMTAFEVRCAGGMTISADGRLGLMEISASVAEDAIAVEYPLYIQQDQPDKATALLVFGAKTPPAVRLNGVAFQGKPIEVQLDGKPAFAYPLFGASAETIRAGIEARYADAMKQLPMP